MSNFTQTEALLHAAAAAFKAANLKTSSALLDQVFASPISWDDFLAMVGPMGPLPDTFARALGEAMSAVPIPVHLASLLLPRPTALSEAFRHAA